jgi:hypothetical protein
MFDDAQLSTAPASLGVAPSKERNLTLMRTMVIVASLFAQSFGPYLFAAHKYQASNSGVEQQLTAQYRLTTVNRGGQITAAGSVVLLQKNGLLVYSLSNPLVPQSTYKNGKITRNPLGGKAFGRDLLNVMKIPGASADIDQRTLVAGAKLWATKMDVQKDGVVVRLYTDPEGAGLYYGELKIPFGKNSVPPADALLIMIAEVLTVQPDEGAAPQPTPDAPVTTSETTPVMTPVTALLAPPDQPAAPPPTVSLGLTIDQVVAIVGQPDRLADLGSKKIYSYKDMKITFVGGKVSDIQ